MAAVNFNIALVFERGIGLVDRHRIDTDVLCKLADGGKAFPQFELSAADAKDDLIAQLHINGRFAGHVELEDHGITPSVLFVS